MSRVQTQKQPNMLKLSFVQVWYSSKRKTPRWLGFLKTEFLMKVLGKDYWCHNRWPNCFQEQGGVQPTSWLLWWTQTHPSPNCTMASLEHLLHCFRYLSATWRTSTKTWKKSAMIRNLELCRRRRKTWGTNLETPVALSSFCSFFMKLSLEKNHVSWLTCW